MGGTEVLPVDPDAIVDIAYVHLGIASIIMQELELAGIPTKHVEQRGHGFYGIPVARVYCYGRDVDRARPIVDRVVTALRENEGLPIEE